LAGGRGRTNEMGKNSYFSTPGLILRLGRKNLRPSGKGERKKVTGETFLSPLAEKGKRTIGPYNTRGGGKGDKKKGKKEKGLPIP